MEIIIKEECRRSEHFEVQIQTKITFEEVVSYVYLGLLMNNTVEEECKLERRLARDNGCAVTLNRLLISKSLSRKSKERVYKAVLGSIFLLDIRKLSDEYEVVK